MASLWCSTAVSASVFFFCCKVCFEGSQFSSNLGLEKCSCGLQMKLLTTAFWTDSLSTKLSMVLPFTNTLISWTHIVPPGHLGQSPFSFRYLSRPSFSLLLTLNSLSYYWSFKIWFKIQLFKSFSSDSILLFCHFCLTCFYPKSPLLHLCLALSKPSSLILFSFTMIERHFDSRSDLIQRHSQFPVSAAPMLLVAHCRPFVENLWLIVSGWLWLRGESELKGLQFDPSLPHSQCQRARYWTTDGLCHSHRKSVAHRCTVWVCVWMAKNCTVKHLVVKTRIQIVQIITN